MTRTHNRRLKRLNKQLEETTPLLKGLDMLKQLESLTPNTKYYFMYDALKTQFTLFFFHVEYEKLLDENNPFYKVIISDDTPEEYEAKAGEEERQALDELDLEKLHETEKQVFEEWLVSSGFAETVLKATRGHEPSVKEVKRVSGNFNRAGINLGHRKINETQGREVWPSDIPKDLEIMYEEMRKKIEAKGRINL